MKHVFDWVDDPDADPQEVPCPHCGAPSKALKIEPDRSASYLREIYLCTADGCKRAWPRYGARALAGVNQTP